MPLNKLSSIKIQKIKKDGLHSDGGGLYVQVRNSTSSNPGKNNELSKSFIFRYSISGKEHWMGLGSFNDITLEDARANATKYRRLKKQGIDPIKKLATQKSIDADSNRTFKQCALEYIEHQKTGWKNHKHESQWRNTLETYAFPVIGEMLVRDIERKHILKILKPIWTTKTETASRIRQRIESILDYATVHDLRKGENPARWRGYLDKVFKRTRKYAWIRIKL